MVSHIMKISHNRPKKEDHLRSLPGVRDEVVEWPSTINRGDTEEKELPESGYFQQRGELAWVP